MAIAAAMVVCLGAAAPAVAASPSVTPASVDGTATTIIGTLTVHAHNLTAAPGPATGTFTVGGSLLPASVPLLGPLSTYSFSGPVTCLDVSGHQAGLVYPITSATGPVGSHFKGLAVYISIQDNGTSEQIGFFGPAPINALGVCPATVSFLPVTSGHVTVTPAS